ncbi:hypothetical protein BLS_002433 [Venturia inaequalis]|uniref:FAD-binding PCMH-type domain-containing protein n=1 Tax=Venturia inaequalis TaxID=5025 RepID=A0A8H3VB13_VENIN|nr:hypothetical protein BLS_002433 [Venturia inaequalis]
MRGSFTWTLVATIPLVSGGAISHNIHALNSPTIQTAPTAAEHTEAVEASKITTCCLNVASVLPGKVYGGAFNFSGYSTQSGSYYSAQEREVKPACFVLPQSSQDVSIAISTLTGPIAIPKSKRKERPGWRLLSSFGVWGGGGDSRASGLKVSRAVAAQKKAAAKAQPNRSDDGVCKFAIRSGGHNPLTESSNINGGITLDLSFMKQVDVSRDRLSVDIGPGNRWQEVYTRLGTQFLGTSGGRVATVGVGGLVTGGGISFFSRERGLVCDNVIEFEVVLSDASIVIANNVTNPDLWRALKGGSGNFGIVTRIKMNAFELGNMWGGVIFHKRDDSSRRTIFKLFEEFTANTEDVNAHWIHTWSYVNAVVLTEWQPSSNIHYTKPIPNPPIFDRLRSRDLDGSVPIIPLLKNDLRIDTLTGLTQQIASLNPDGYRQIFTSLTFKNSAAFMEEVFQIGNDIAPGIKWVTGLRWVQSRAEQLGVQHPFVHLNYADRWQDPVKGYGVKNVNALRNVAARYDRRGLWQSKQVPGGFKLFEPASMVIKKEKKIVADGADSQAQAKDGPGSGNVADPFASGLPKGPPPVDLPPVDVPAIPKEVEDVPAVVVPVEDVSVMPGHGGKGSV